MSVTAICNSNQESPKLHSGDWAGVVAQNEIPDGYLAADSLVSLWIQLNFCASPSHERQGDIPLAASVLMTNLLFLSVVPIHAALPDEEYNRMAASIRGWSRRTAIPAIVSPRTTA
jgi:hypothetical protein